MTNNNDDDKMMNDDGKNKTEPSMDKATDEMEEKLAAAEKQRDEYLDGWKRAKADFINYKKEEYRRLEDVARYGNEELLKELITVLDNFDLGLQALEKAGTVERGIYMIRTQIEDILKRRGLERIAVKPGDKFDPSFTEAVAEVDPPAGGEYPPGTIVEEIETGYRLYDKILRPARVKVAKVPHANGH